MREPEVRAFFGYSPPHVTGFESPGADYFAADGSIMIITGRNFGKRKQINRNGNITAVDLPRSLKSPPIREANPAVEMSKHELHLVNLLLVDRRESFENLVNISDGVKIVKSNMVNERNIIQDAHSESRKVENDVDMEVEHLVKQEKHPTYI